MCAVCDNATPATLIGKLIDKVNDQNHRLTELENLVQQLRGSVQILSPGRSR